MAKKEVKKVEKKVVNKKVSKRVSEKSEPKHTFTITINGVKQVVCGETVEKALAEIKMPDSIKTEMIIDSKYMGKQKQKILGTFAVRRIFGNNTSMKLLASNLTKLING